MIPGKILFIAAVMAISTTLFAQQPKHVVFLKNKDNNPYSLDNPLAFLTQRALDRRSKAGIPLDLKDLPVTPSYISQIASAGAAVVYPLKWFNAVVISTGNPQVLATIQSFPFVDHIDQVAPLDGPVTTRIPGYQAINGVPPFTLEKAGPATRPEQPGSIDYGLAYNQAHMIAVDGLHDMGYTGQGMMIAVLDDGFYHVDQIAAFDSLRLSGRILGTRDFNDPGNNVYGDHMHYHGTSVLSTMGANIPGTFVGTAPGASYWLVRTEVFDYEALIEEYNWAGGAEFADSLGADIINSSLGYTTFNNPAYDHTYADMNGHTTPVTRAADIATSRGILVVNSAGNSGSSAWHYIGAPADGDSVFSIGAVDAGGNYAYFSSTGPTSDGRIKPDVATQGLGAAVIGPDGSAGFSNGTSFSSPIMAGALACLWQSGTGYSAEQLRMAVRYTASKASAPDSLYGWGIPDLMDARTHLDVEEKSIPVAGRFLLCPQPFSSSPDLKWTVEGRITVNVDIFNLTGSLLGSVSGTFHGPGQMRLERLNICPPGIYFLEISADGIRQVIRAVKI